MGGDVTVESSPGAGSTFTVTLDLIAAPADSPLVTLPAVELPATMPAPATHFDGNNVLVVDDHPINREVLVRQLESTFPDTNKEWGIQVMPLRAQIAGGVVTTGPYRFFRHPIYAAFCLFTSAGVAANWSWSAGLFGGLVLGLQ